MNKEKIYIASCSFCKDRLAQIHNEPIDLMVYCEVMFNDKISG